MFQIIREGGWPMYFILALGAASLGVAMRFARDPQKDLLGVVIGLASATLLAGALGTVLGVMISIGAIREVPADDRWVVLIGLKESLNNLGLALAFAIADALLVTKGWWQRARSMPPA